MNLKRIKKQLVPKFIDFVSKHTNNPRFNSSQLYKFVSGSEDAFEKFCKDKAIDFFCLEDDGKCLAVCILKKYPNEEIIYVNELMAIEKGKGKDLIQMLLDKYPNIWWTADYNGGESLLDYYRKFGLKEINLGPTVWSGKNDHHVFYQVSSKENEKMILDRTNEWKT